ncbi:MAG TPA: LytR C-terminal domain-containing protein, partial [Elusimicrobiales bacterium]|nr:LytR C-terminal domain-containing protein [Elusimicrobiales bacterium]
LIKVFNATDKKRLARQITDYLRFLNGKGILNIDVVGYGNWYGKKEKSEITASSGRFLELSKLAEELGLTSTAIFFKRNKLSFADAVLIAGKDIKLPKADGWKTQEMLH